LHPFKSRAALLLSGVAFDFIAQGKKQRLLAAAAYFNLLAVAISSIPVLITGFLAWQGQLVGQGLKGILRMHLWAGWLSSALHWVVQESSARASNGPTGILLTR
jgi:hypothetical protein